MESSSELLEKEGQVASTMELLSLLSRKETSLTGFIAGCRLGIVASVHPGV